MNSAKLKRVKVIIMGAAGRDFHNFNTIYRNNPRYEVVAFTATQIPHISDRTYPAELSGRLYPKGIPIYPETKLSYLIRKHDVEEVIMSYSDLHHTTVMHSAAIVNAIGADFVMLGAKYTMLESKKPVVAVTAVRTGCGKSQTTRKIASILRKAGKNVVVVRHPMPYGNLTEQICQKFTTMKDLHTHKCTIEEREEYEPLIEMGVVLFAGVDYEKILRAAERELGHKSGVIIWDGGNNDTPFFKPDLHITLVDPLRPNHEKSFYPGETNFRMADVIIINKEKSAKPSALKIVKNNIQRYNPGAVVIDAASAITLDESKLIKGKKVLVIEDGPTLTHGGMSFGAGTIAAKRFGAKPIDPRPYATGSIKEVFKKYTHLKNVLPAMGYTPSQLKELRKIINNAKCDAVVSGTPIDLRRVFNANKPILRIRYDLQEIGKPTLSGVLEKLMKKVF
jgi:predicted GTPase